MIPTTPRNNPKYQKNPSSREQRDRSDHQPHFQENFSQIKSVGPISLVADLRFHLVGFFLDPFLFVFVARRFPGIFLAQLSQSGSVRGRFHRSQIDEELVRVPPNVLSLVKSPLIRRLRLEHNLFGVSAMSE